MCFEVPAWLRASPVVGWAESGGRVSAVVGGLVFVVFLLCCFDYSGVPLAVGYPIRGIPVDSPERRVPCKLCCSGGPAAVALPAD